MTINYTSINDYLDKVLKINNEINLTRITGKREAELLHIEDSLSALKELNEAPPGFYADLGSGGGFPGVPLSIATGRTTYLIDSVQKKMKAVEKILEEINLSQQITTLPLRIEEVSKDYPNYFSALTARALTSLPSLLELASPLLKQNGRLICLKSHIDQEEYQTATNIQSKVGMRLYSDRELLLSDNTTYRRILVFEKYKDPEITLPRRIGMAQKKPLK